MTNAYRRLPSVDRVLAEAEAKQAATELGTGVVTQAVRAELAARRAGIAAGDGSFALEEIVAAAVSSAYAALRPSLRPVINATGVIIHTNLGRAPLSDAARAAMESVSRGYSNLEFDLTEGERGSRYDHLESLLCQVTGAEAAIAVNNNASALLLVLSALAQGRDVVISRGQLVEIGGGFRIPDVMAQSGARLVEVGTTNRTYVRDYEDATSDSTVALMRVHTSNFRVQGFVAAAEVADLAAVAHARGILCLDDLGSGCLLDTRPFGLAPEPTPQESIQSGVDLVLFSGDKLLGGPQAGIIAGKQDLVAKLRRHPLARALRMDKASIAALNATLLHYVRQEATAMVPVWRMIAMPLPQIEARARRWRRAISAGDIVVSTSMVGGGSLPEESLPSRVLALTAVSSTVEELAAGLRAADPPVIGRIDHDRLLLDPRTVQPGEDAALVTAVRAALALIP
jgi:L-seryl-tRNA(Ser) seleniumtransferase